MRIAAGVLTWNAKSNDRLHLLEQTVESLQDADLLLIADNGSTDTSSGFVSDLGGILFPTLKGFPHGNTCGYGMNKLAATLRGNADIILLSNDDMTWKPGAIQTLREVWADAPIELTILSGLVEPTFALPGLAPWNEPAGILEVSDHRLLARRSVPGGAWTYRDETYPLIFPVSTFPGVDDVPACHRIIDNGGVVACLDLAEHSGLGVSTWGNGSERFMVQSLEEVKAEWFA